MVIRINTTCPRCGKEESVFGMDSICNECQLRGVMKSRIKMQRREMRINKEIALMKPAIKEKLHDEILKEILKEEELIEKLTK